jgi:hypothetical protein
MFAVRVSALEYLLASVIEIMPNCERCSTLYCRP